MTTIIRVMDEKTGQITVGAIYTLNPKKAMVCFIEQYINKNQNWWTYPEIITGMKESLIRPDTWNYDNGDIILQAYQEA